MGYFVGVDLHGDDDYGSSPYRVGKKERKKS